MPADNGHGRIVLPVAGGGRGWGHRIFFSGAGLWSKYQPGFYPLPSLTRSSGREWSGGVGGGSSVFARHDEAKEGATSQAHVVHPLRERASALACALQSAGSRSPRRFTQSALGLPGLTPRSLSDGCLLLRTDRRADVSATNTSRARCVRARNNRLTHVCCSFSVHRQTTETLRNALVPEPSIPRTSLCVWRTCAAPAPHRHLSPAHVASCAPAACLTQEAVSGLSTAEARSGAPPDCRTREQQAAAGE